MSKEDRFIGLSVRIDNDKEADEADFETIREELERIAAWLPRHLLAEVLVR